MNDITKFNDKYLKCVVTKEQLMENMYKVES